MHFLVRRPSWSPGNVGDEALLTTLETHLMEAGISYEIPEQEDFQKAQIEGYDALVYFGNDCIAYYDISKNSILRFISADKPIYLINTSYGEDAINNDFVSKVSKYRKLFIFARDAYSQRILNRNFSFTNQPILVSDLAHLRKATPLGSSPRMEEWLDSSDKKVVGVNLHGDFKDGNKAVYEAMSTFIRQHSNAYRFLFIPHDSRKDDYRLLASLAEGTDGDIFITKELDSGYEKSVLSRLFFVITGRMHLAILSLSAGVPCIAIAYNGIKAIGTFEHWDLSDYVVSAHESGKILPHFEAAVSDYSQIRSKLKASRPKVEELAWRQIRLLRTPPEAAPKSLASYLLRMKYFLLFRVRSYIGRP
ncbi:MULTISPECIES: polysaccharide pyruvyl transferase family protein [unclassified Cyanobium]|uniref:polysaccharide pyruvyl transferase family protein n=1 Tax=unclassified Cyanobium TaxID=2627006 RepID=UPI0020CB95D9|nr:MULTISPECIES: polysaccharide pyruvyl transferase family protein [unclassified Cyanobium]